MSKGSGSRKFTKEGQESYRNNKFWDKANNSKETGNNENKSNKTG